jgi:hypothetical protein
VLPQLIAILKKVRAAQNDCYNDDEARWYWAFRESNVKRMGLDAYYLPQEWKGEKFRSMTVNRTKSASPASASAKKSTSPKSSPASAKTEKPNRTKAVSPVTHAGGTSPRSASSADMDKLIKNIVKHLPQDMHGVITKFHQENLDRTLMGRNPLAHPSKEQIRSMLHENKETVLAGWSPFFEFNGKQYRTLTSYKRSIGVMLNFEMYEIDPDLERRRLNAENMGEHMGWPHPLIGKASISRNYKLIVTCASNDIAAEQYFVAALAIRMRYLNLDTPEILDSGLYNINVTEGQTTTYRAKTFRERVIELFHDENNLKIIQDMYISTDIHRKMEASAWERATAAVAAKATPAKQAKPTLAEMASRAKTAASQKKGGSRKKL